MERRARIIVTAGLAIGLLAAALDQTVVDTAFPRMIADLGGVAIFTWVITTYMLASTAVVPVVGKLADIFGRKIFYLLGMLLFMGGSALCGLAQTMPQLIIFRGIQGLGAGVLQPIVFTLIGDLYPGEQRAKLQGVFGAIWGLSSIFGPKLGGWLTHNFSWRWVFYVNIPIGILAFVIILLGLRESKGERRPVDYVGAVTITGGIVAFLLALEVGGKNYPWGSWQIIGLFAVAVILLTIFAVTELRVPEPVLNFRLFRVRTYAIMSATSVLMGIGLFGCLIFVPWFIQGVVGVDPNTAGNVMTPMMISVVITATLSGRLSVKVPYRTLLAAGFGLLCVGYLLMTRWSVTTTLLQATVTSIVVGLGMGFLMPVMTLAVQNAVGPRERGQVTSGITFFRSVGATLGTTILGVVFNHGMANHIPLLQQELQPVLSQMPREALAAASQHMQAFLAKPEGLAQVLLQEKIRAAIPAPMLPPLVTGIKAMMVASLHTVFWTGFALVLAGFVVSMFLGSVNLRTQTQELEAQGNQASTEPVLAE